MKIESLSDQLKLDNLPLDYDLLNEEIDKSDFSERLFVKQLELIGIVNPKRVIRAVRDYFFAFTQRTKWVDEHLVVFSELDRYEHTLIDEWDIRFQIMLDNLKDVVSEEKHCESARRIYEWVETEDLHRIRNRVNEPIFARGSYQILADNLSVGWHPQFQERLKHLIQVLEG